MGFGGGPHRRRAELPDVRVALQHDADRDTRTHHILTRSAAPIVREYTLAPTSRQTVWVNTQVPELAGERFGAIIESLDSVPIVVERAMDRASGGIEFALGTNATAARVP